MFCSAHSYLEFMNKQQLLFKHLTLCLFPFPPITPSCSGRVVGCRVMIRTETCDWVFLLIASPSSSSRLSVKPSASLTDRSVVACLAFTVSILHLEFRDAICSWQPLIFWASSCLDQNKQNTEDVIQLQERSVWLNTNSRC